MTLRIGTRQSALAQAQTGWVASKLKALDPSLTVETILITTSGDRQSAGQSTDIPLKGLFTKELDEALRDERIDLAVHSFKDIPPGPLGLLNLIAVPERETANDAWVSRDGTTLLNLPLGACVGTSSVRRRALLLRARPDLKVIALRGNVDTRMVKLRDGSLDGMVLAVAGLKRLGLQDHITETLSLDHFTPAAGQGALGLMVRDLDVKKKRADFSALLQLDHKPSHAAALCEQTCLEVLAGSCHTPIGVHAAWDGSAFQIQGLVLHPAGTESVSAERANVPPSFNPLLTGRQLAEELIARGGQRLLRL
jgi:hydroxymethylbilane synthase